MGNNRLSDGVSNLYCQCTDAECGHSWVATLSLADTLSPSAKITNQMVLSLMSSLTPEGGVGTEITGATNVVFFTTIHIKI
ncbi:ogr/Delta-like zinc finger family protein [Aeromonas hydrophila]|uniref:ogr/Delta-like zinc finger family protein n=1 Tax=Aeromonas hydrophila TaxID=644 RepID=UPI00280F8E5F|nr:ogr/Delta-like zinc finger family protein [Aeromonas hydrophila]HDU8490401.1 ogr/Delta-like zinc finger family protein [Aeromonas hydrophila]